MQKCFYIEFKSKPLRKLLEKTLKDAGVKARLKDRKSRRAGFVPLSLIWETLAVDIAVPKQLDGADALQQILSLSL
jgi:hypothetical protein